MNEAAWGIIVLVVFPLLQFPVILYLSRRVETDEELPPPDGGYATYPFDGDRSQPSASTAQSHSSTPDSHSPPLVRTCPRCGMENARDAAFTYCRNCTARLQ